MAWQVINDGDIITYGAAVEEFTDFNEDGVLVHIWDEDSGEGPAPEQCGDPKANIDAQNNLTWSCPDTGNCSGSCTPHKFNVSQNGKEYNIRCNCNG